MIKKAIDVKVRPIANPSLEKSSLLGAARIYVSKDSLISLTGGIENGKHCIVELLDHDPQPPLKREASLWILPEKNLSPNVVMMTRVFQEATGFKLGDQVRIALAGTTPEASEITVQDLSGDPTELEAKLPLKKAFWEAVLGDYFDRADLIFPGMVFEGVTVGRRRRNFKVTSVNSLSTNLARFTPSSVVQILDPDQEASSAIQFTGGHLAITGVPGLPHEMEVINDFLVAFSRPFRGEDQRMSCGFVIHGGRNTGKTFILKRMAETNWGRPHWIRPSDKLATIRETLKLAQSQRPSMVFIDALDELLNKDRTNRESVIETLCQELDALSAEAKANQALPSVVVMATCSDYITDVPAKLQQQARLCNNIALSIPTAPGRLEILKFINPPIKAEEKEQALRNVAQKTHAYNGADLVTLVLNAWTILDRRLRAQGIDSSTGEYLTGDDLEQALGNTRASAMHDINLKPPTVHWQDVGGQESLKRVLSRMIKNMKNPQLTRSLLRNPPKGLLLYGPPGCSKTLSAQAMATESGFNFFSVKGAELLNMYVGESERAVRMLFERARRAKPSIIFFDEIDSIGGQRTGAGASRSASAVNMLTTLLTEMDGFEALKGVLILAATNRPEFMDPALLRPGRFDQVVYVGPPDFAAREAIFNVHLRGLSLAVDVSIKELARLSEGYSGAEIMAICTQAGLAAMDRYDDLEGEVKERQEICMVDFQTGMQKTRKNITAAMVTGYEKWSKQFATT